MLHGELTPGWLDRRSVHRRDVGQAPQLAFRVHAKRGGASQAKKSGSRARGVGQGLRAKTQVITSRAPASRTRRAASLSERPVSTTSSSTRPGGRPSGAADRRGPGSGRGWYGRRHRKPAIARRTRRACRAWPAPGHVGREPEAAGQQADRDRVVGDAWRDRRRQLGDPGVHLGLAEQDFEVRRRFDHRAVFVAAGAAGAGVLVAAAGAGAGTGVAGVANEGGRGGALTAGVSLAGPRRATLEACGVTAGADCMLPDADEAPMAKSAARFAAEYGGVGDRGAEAARRARRNAWIGEAGDLSRTRLPWALSKVMRSGGAITERPTTLRITPVTSRAAWPSSKAGSACSCSITSPVGFTASPTAA